MSTSARALPLVDTLLIEFTPRAQSDAELRCALEEAAAATGLPRAPLHAFRAVLEPRVAAYLDCTTASDSIERIRASMGAALAPVAASIVEVSRMSARLAIAGASFGAAADFHYVVRTDVTDGGKTELERWYDEEHMPSLAAVPGAIMARRLIALDVPPPYYACYDLTTPDILKSPPWLAVRATDWSGRVRPTFRDTSRIMFRRLA
jgi:hypothetical protein